MSATLTTKNLVLFYFHDDMSRCGINSAYLMGFDPNDADAEYIGVSEARLPNGKLVEKNGAGYTIYPGLVLEKNQNLENARYFIKRTLRGKKPEDFEVDNCVDAGMGNFGYCVGAHEVGVSGDRVADES